MHTNHGLPKGAFVKAAEAAAAIPVPLRTFHHYVKNGQIPSYRLGKHRFFKIADVLAAVEATRVGTVQEVLR